MWGGVEFNVGLRHGCLGRSFHLKVTPFPLLCREMMYRRVRLSDVSAPVSLPCFSSLSLLCHPPVLSPPLPLPIPSLSPLLPPPISVSHERGRQIQDSPAFVMGHVVPGAEAALGEQSSLVGPGQE